MRLTSAVVFPVPADASTTQLRSRLHSTCGPAHRHARSSLSGFSSTADFSRSRSSSWRAHNFILPAAARVNIGAAIASTDVLHSTCGLLISPRSQFFERLQFYRRLFAQARQLVSGAPGHIVRRSHRLHHAIGWRRGSTPSVDCSSPRSQFSERFQFHHRFLAPACQLVPRAPLHIVRRGKRRGSTPHADCSSPRSQFFERLQFHRRFLAQPLLFVRAADRQKLALLTCVFARRGRQEAVAQSVVDDL